MIKTISKHLAVYIVILQLLGAGVAMAGTLKPDCQADLPPSDARGCGFAAFITFVRKLIGQFLIIIVPIATLMIVWGAFVIMTSSGNPEKVSSGRKTIFIALTGVVIAFGAWLILITISKFFFVEQFQIQ